MPDGSSAWLAVQDRSQKRAALLEIDLSDNAFPTVLHDQTSEFWVILRVFIRFRIAAVSVTWARR